MGLRDLDWNLINPFERKPKEERKKEKEQEEKELEPVRPIVHKYMTRVVFGTMGFVLVGGLILIFAFRDASAQVVFGLLAILVFLSTLVFGAMLYVALGALQKTALEAKRKKAAEPPEKWDMPKREKL